MRFFDSIFFAKYYNSQEPFLEPIFRTLRFGVARRDLQRLCQPQTQILDFGCGPETQLLKYLTDQKLPFQQYVGYDPVVPITSRETSKARFETVYNRLSKNHFDVVTMFAVLEHLPYPNFEYQQVAKLLKPGGVLLLTTPARRAKPVLEFLSFQLGIVSRREIEEHTHYFSASEIRQAMGSTGLTPLKELSFELGFNTYAVFKKFKLCDSHAQPNQHCD